MTINLFDTIAYGYYDVPNQLKTLADFLIKNRTLRIPTTELGSIYKTNVLSNTAIKAIFNDAFSAGKLDLISPIKIPKEPLNIPEYITTDLFVLDVLQVKDIDLTAYKALNTLPEYSDRIILNFTQFLKAQSYVPNDMPGIQSECVRALLFRSYYNSSEWLTPDLLLFLAKSYSMIISSMVGRRYTLDYNQRNVIATILTIYFYQMCSSDTTPKELPLMALNNATYLGNRINVKDQFDMIKEELGDDLLLDLSRVCELIAKLVPQRLSKFSTREFYSILQSLNSSKPMTNILSLQYPPQWAHSVLLAVSGVNKKMAIELKNIGDLKKESLGFAERIRSSSKFIPNL